MLLLGNSAWAQALESLKRVRAPQPSGLEKYVKDAEALVVLGKALFWDMQTGSDGRTACATCHFHAGADHRLRNQLGKISGEPEVNHLLSVGDFPFRVLSDINDNRSAAVRDTPAVAGSAGVFRRLFLDVGLDGGSDEGLDLRDAPAFSRNGINTRQVTARNTPTVINAVFYFRNFWDGRASNIFTVLTPFGDSDARNNALAVVDGSIVPHRVRLEDSSLASQAVGPALNAVEMSYEGRNWPKLAKRVLGLAPLALQRVAEDDSVLGRLANVGGRGLLAGITYQSLIQAAFQPQYWNYGELVDAGFTLAEHNFPLFWGLALQAYQATLVSDDSRFDRFSEGSGDALTAEEQQGLQIFRGRGECTDCHVGAEFSAAGVTSVRRNGLLQRNRNRDTGFFRIGVRPIAEDAGLGATDDFGQAFSAVGAAPSVQGTFKAPTLRNVEFTGPYFHNGGQATLAQVVDFYSRGGDFPGDGNLGPGIGRRNFSPADRRALAAFLLSLTDDRVRFERAPFDHPELCVPDGHLEYSDRVLQIDGSDRRFLLSSADRWVGIPAVGRNGNTVPLQTFEELLAGTGADGSRAHALNEACGIVSPAAH
jgi:cytochrome c peroxidase